MAKIRIGTRSSPLARWQAVWVHDTLVAAGFAAELVFITTQGDVKTGPLGAIGGQGLFTKEIQRALLAHEVDLAVHSLKDLPTEPVAGLLLAAVPERESTADVFLSNQWTEFSQLPHAARVGTGSLRRRTQLLHVRPDLQVLDIRGNLDTRLRKLDEGEYDAIVLAEAGLRRLGLTDRIRHVLPADTMLPAVGQGALGVETRADDDETRAAVQVLDHSPSHLAVLAERSLLAALRGGCLAPIGALATVQQETLTLRGVVLDVAGRERLEAALSGPAADAITLGEKLAQELREMGAEALIATSRQRESQ
jgi:hydroxymethylbilane synthase